MNRSTGRKLMSLTLLIGSLMTIAGCASVRSSPEDIARTQRAEKIISHLNP